MLRKLGVLTQSVLWLTSRARLLGVWFAGEFLHIAVGSGACSIVTSVCRLLGVGVIVAVVRVCLSGGLAPDLFIAGTQCVLAAVLGVMVGNLAKEAAIDCCAQVFGRLQRNFTRRGRTFDGKIYRETLYPDGTWFRSESGPHGTVCEWTDTSGACNRIETGPRERTRR